jgi:uncharacterized membrane protein YgcG
VAVGTDALAPRFGRVTESRMKKLIVSMALLGLSAFAWALPTLQQVEAEVRQGHYAQAESMMREVVAAKPGSARAHYIYAEILAHDGNLARAAEEAKTARQIDPDVKFTDPEKFRSFEAALLRAQTPAARPPLTPPSVDAAAPTQVAPARVAPAPVAAAAMPSWVWLAGLAAIAFFLWRFFSRSRGASVAGAALPGSGYGAPMPTGPAGAPYGAGAAAAPYGPGYAPQRPGSGMLGVGLGAAGGLAAGMLAERLLHSRQDGSVQRDTGTSGGFFDSPQGAGAANDLDSRPIDFGTGGNDWDSGASDVGGGSDGGGSDGGGGWD